MELSDTMEQEMNEIVPHSPQRGRSATVAIQRQNRTSKPGGIKLMEKTAPPVSLTPNSSGSGVHAARALSSSNESTPSPLISPRELRALRSLRTGPGSNSSGLALDSASMASFAQAATTQRLLAAFDRGQRDLFYAQLHVLLGSPESADDLFAPPARRPLSRQALAEELSEEAQEEMMHQMQAAAEAGAASPRLLEFQLRIHFVLHALKGQGAQATDSDRINQLQKEQMHFRVWCQLSTHHFQTRTNVLKYCALGYIKDIRACGL